MHLFVVNYEIIFPIRGLSILTEGDFRPLKPQKVKITPAVEAFNLV